MLLSNVYFLLIFHCLISMTSDPPMLVKHEILPAQRIFKIVGVLKLLIVGVLSTFHPLNERSPKLQQ